MNAFVKSRRDESSNDDNMKETCCDVLGRELKTGKYQTNKTAYSAEWIPAFVQKVDAEKCIGCGSCVKVCLGNCYELQEKIVNGEKKKVSVAVRPENCFGDCHCHKVCLIIGGAMVCKPKMSEEYGI